MNSAADLPLDPPSTTEVPASLPAIARQQPQIILAHQSMITIDFDENGNLQIRQDNYPGMTPLCWSTATISTSSSTN